MFAKISLFILCDFAELVCSVVSDQNLATNLFFSLTNCILVTKYKPKKLNRVKLKADNTYTAYPFIKSNLSIIIYLSLYFLFLSVLYYISLRKLTMKKEQMPQSLSIKGKALMNELSFLIKY